MYCRYSANSTLKPLYGLRCSPERNPSTTVRAFSSIVPSRVRTAGSRKRTSREVGAAMLHAAARDGNSLEQPIDDLIGGHPLGLGVEVRDDAMPQHRAGQRLDVG